MNDLGLFDATNLTQDLQLDNDISETDKISAIPKAKRLPFVEHRDFGLRDIRDSRREKLAGERCLIDCFEKART